MSIQGTNSHPYLTMDDAIVQERNARQSYGPLPTGPSLVEMIERAKQNLEAQQQATASTSAWNDQVGGGHYKSQGIQPMEYSMANNLDSLQHSIIKYVTRFRQKNGVVDLRKARHCIDMLIEWEEKGGKIK